MIIRLNKNDYRSHYSYKELDNAMKCMREYHEVSLMQKAGEITIGEAKKRWSKIFEKSGYINPIDFHTDYMRYQVGLPLYIKIELV